MSRRLLFGRPVAVNADQTPRYSDMRLAEPSQPLVLDQTVECGEDDQFPAGWRGDRAEMAEPEAEAATGLERYRKLAHPFRIRQPGGNHGDAGEPSPAHHPLEDRARIAPWLEGVDPALRRQRGEELAELAGVRPGIDDDRVAGDVAS